MDLCYKDRLRNAGGLFLDTRRVNKYVHKSSIVIVDEYMIKKYDNTVLF